MTIAQNVPSYTGDIAAQQIDSSKEYSAENQEIAFSAEQHAIWADLYAGVHQPYLLEHICQEWKTGMELLQLDLSGISTVSHLNDRITPRIGWRIEDKFAPAYMKATQEEREVIKRLAWYSTEFGLVVQEQYE